MALFPPLEVVDYSGQITAGGTAQDVYSAAQQPEEALEFYNTSSATMYIDWDKPATAAAGVPVAPGMGWISTPSLMPKGRLSVLCATTDATFICKAM